MRGSGRTQRMLETAIADAQAGRAVYVMAADKQHRAYLERRLADMGTEGLGIKIETPNSTGNFDWDRMALVGAHPNCLTFVDHWAIEKRFERILRELHRWDI
jgi:hypothetical protein